MDPLDLVFARCAEEARRLDACMAGVGAALAICAFALVFAPALAVWWQGAPA